MRTTQWQNQYIACTLVTSSELPRTVVLVATSGAWMLHESFIGTDDEDGTGGRRGAG